jgi:hypothetical protein
VLEMKGREVFVKFEGRPEGCRHAGGHGVEKVYVKDIVVADRHRRVGGP